MIKDFLIIDNALDNIDELVKLSNSVDYFSAEKTLMEGINLTTSTDTPTGLWRGYRSHLLSHINKCLFLKTANSMMYDIFKMENYTYNTSCYFNKMPKLNGVKDTDWWHVDNCLFAGVVYMTESPEKNSGTLLNINNDIVEVENVYNRLVIYKSSIMHRPQNTFGDNIYNCRSTLSFFIEDITFSKKFED